MIAHSVHWLEQAILLVPTVGFIGWIAFVALRDRRRRRAAEAPRE